MVYKHSAQKAKIYFEKVMERVVADDLPPTPTVYEVLYVYYSGENADVTRAIDVMDAKNETLTLEACQSMFQEFVSDDESNEQIKEAGSRIQDTIQGVSGVVSNVKTATSEYNSNIGGLSEKLTDDMSPEQIKAVVGEIKSGTQEMLEQNSHLEQELERSTMIMEELRKDLEAVRKEAFTDALTGLKNRKAFDTEIERILQESESSGTAFSLIMFDIDHFKSFNDNFGHQVGDQVLRLVARTLKEGVKGKDVAARYGGEEFSIILPETNLVSSLQVAEILRKAVASKDIVNRATGEKLAKITLSAGVAERLADESVESLISRADKALYSAKHNGRNQAVTAPSGNPNEGYDS